MYYRLHYSYDREIIGKFPQVYEAIVPTSLDDPNYISFLLWEKASNNTLVAKGVLSPHAKITDLLSCAFMGYSGRLYVSLKLKMILQKSYIGLQFLKTGLVDNKQD